MDLDPAGLAIGLALSGGGVRAAVFHLGVLDRLARSVLLERVTHISSVSGGSLAVGLVFSAPNGGWPTSNEYLHARARDIRNRMITADLELDALRRAATRPSLLLRGRAGLIAGSLESSWGVTGRVSELPPVPTWTINATTYQTGKNWRFTWKRMGDYVTGYVPFPHVPLAEAIAASAALPGLLGPLVIRSDEYSWYAFTNNGNPGQMIAIQPAMARYHLWDGGVADNLGLEALHKPSGNRLRDGVNFLVVSDASAAPGIAAKRATLGSAKRLIDIASQQVRGLRVRQVMETFVSRPGSGAYLRMGKDANYILSGAGLPTDEVAAAVVDYLSPAEVAAAHAHPTRLHRLAPDAFDRLYRHGWEVADTTLAGLYPQTFPRMGNRPAGTLANPGLAGAT